MYMQILIIILLPVLFLLWSNDKRRRLLNSCGFPVLPYSNPFTKNLNLFVSPTTIFQFGTLRKKYGKTYGAMCGSQPVIITSDVNLIVQVSQKLYANFHSRLLLPWDPHPIADDSVHMFGARGARWKRLRTITSQAISSYNMKQLFPIIDDSVQSFMKHLAYIIKTTNGKIGHSTFQNHTSDVLARCAFGQEKSSHSDNIYHSIFSSAFGENLHADSWQVLSWCIPSLASLAQSTNSIISSLRSLVSRRTNVNTISAFNGLLSELRNERRSGEAKNDFLQFFKNAECVGYRGYQDELSQGHVDVAQLRIEKVMSPGETVAQCRFISIAGFDTTANTLIYLCDLLAKNQGKLQLLHSELDSVDELDYSAVNSLPYLQLCIHETLRIYPHASPLQHRTCMSSCKIEDITINAGVAVIVDTWSVHHDTDIWGDDVEDFIPERHKQMTAEQRQAFMPFGLGPRQCVGMRFALLEIKLTVAHLLKTYTIAPKDPTEKLTLTLRDTGTVWPDRLGIQLVRRS